MELLLWGSEKGEWGVACLHELGSQWKSLDLRKLRHTNFQEALIWLLLVICITIRGGISQKTYVTIPIMQGSSGGRYHNNHLQLQYVMQCCFLITRQPRQLTNSSLFGRLFPQGLVSSPSEVVKKKIDLICLIFFLKPPCANSYLAHEIEFARCQWYLQCSLALGPRRIKFTLKTTM
jgi:hypothetical protein